MSAPTASPFARQTGPVIAIGECMVELTRGADARFGLAYGGDTFNTAVYMGRAGVAVSYATALGDDRYSAGIREAARIEGVSTELMMTLPGRMPGLYLIETDERGERTFWYWRDRAAARDLFECDHTEAVVAAIGTSRLVYVSGVTLSLYSPLGLNVLADALGAARSAGATVVMDSNYRPRGWGGDLRRARATFERFWRLAQVAMPTFDDEQALWSDVGPEATIGRLRELGPVEIVVKNGAQSAVVLVNGEISTVPAPPVGKPVDTTAAGDSFNAGYLSRRLAGDAPSDADAYWATSSRASSSCTQARSCRAMRRPLFFAAHERRLAACRASVVIAVQSPAATALAGATQEPPTAATFASSR